MNKIKIFLAAPISGFKDESQYKKNRENLRSLINHLMGRFQVYSEISHISSIASCDTPEESAIKDLGKINESDIFIIYHPMSMQTSTLIELGYAIAKQKRIIIIAQPEALPYLALGLPKYSLNIKNIPFSEINKAVIGWVDTVIDEFIESPFL